ncbi:MAG: murein biosynthesis integral membrane protein MurJ [Chakrabartia sp.]
MKLGKAIGTIGGLTMVSRVLGFAREMIASRYLGAGAAAEVFQLAFLIPNLFRRLFGEGAFSSGFVPLFSKRLNGEGGIEDAQEFANEVLAVFAPALMLITALFMIFMPAFIGLMVPDDWGGGNEKTQLAIQLTRITMPYMVLICLVSLLSGVLNSLTRFTAAAFAPSLLNIALVGALLLVPRAGANTARAMATAVIIGGILQFILCWISVRRAGVKLNLFRLPRMTDRVRELFILILPATLAGGIYYISQFFYAFFATRLPEGTLVYLAYADRLNQLPLAIIGSALGTAILPAVSKAVDTGDGTEAGKIQGQAIELGMLLTLPAAVALAIVAWPVAAALFQGGAFSAEDARLTGMVLSIIVAGLPAYVLIKVLTPGFYARKDMKTPVWIAVAMLMVGVVLNFALLGTLGIATLPATTALTAWGNCLILYAILHKRGHFKIEGWLLSRIIRQLIAATAMGVVLWLLVHQLSGLFAGSAIERLMSIGALVGAGGLVYFGVGWIIGAINRDDVMVLLRRKKASD